MCGSIGRSTGEIEMKKAFLEPELEVIRFKKEDIITTSVVNNEGVEGDIGGEVDEEDFD